MRHWRRGASCVLAGLVLSACTYVQPVVAPGPWDIYGDVGPLRVHGAPADAPGRLVYRTLRARPRLGAILQREGEPDTLEVVGGRWAPKRIVLTYRRRGAGRPRRIVLEPVAEGFAARRALPLHGGDRAIAASSSSRPARARQRAAEPRPEADGPAREPTRRQTLECPIDPTRADCRAFCTAGAGHEWCE